MPYHKMLENQIRNLLTEEQLNNPRILHFLQQINEQYTILEKDRLLAEMTINTKNNFMSAMSHEIRTPLNTIIGIAHLLTQDKLTPVQLENMKTLNTSANNLLNFVNDILDFGKIEAGKVELSENNTDLRQLANNLRTNHRVRAEENGNTLRILMDDELPRFIRIDDARLTQVLDKLISNAINFTRHGSVTIEMQLQEVHGEEVTINFAVTDTGIGIEKERQPLIFNRFHQADDQPKPLFQGGPGMGLIIAQRLLSMYNSEIKFTSEPGLGSKFFFALTCKKVTGSLTQESFLLNNNDLSNIKILLAEDVEHNIIVAEKMIANWNAKVETAENGIQAVSKARQDKYDIVLMDLQMPVMDGFSASRHIREFNNAIPIIALTASATSDISVRTKEYGMNDYLLKPIKPVELYDIIYKYTHNMRKAS